VIGAAIMLGGAIAFAALGVWLRRHGRPIAAEMSNVMSFPGSLVLAMPFLQAEIDYARRRGVDFWTLGAHLGT
jgi:hypothetical protein